MFEQIIQTSFDSASEIIVRIRGVDHTFRGKVQDYDGTHFTLFNNGQQQGLLWAFKVDDILTCALIVPLPENEPQSVASPAFGGRSGKPPLM